MRTDENEMVEGFVEIHTEQILSKNRETSEKSI